MKLDRHSSVPLYFQLKEYILDKIGSGYFPAGTKIQIGRASCRERVEISVVGESLKKKKKKNKQRRKHKHITNNSN